jgi:hypothetical protein
MASPEFRGQKWRPAPLFVSCAALTCSIKTPGPAASRLPAQQTWQSGRTAGQSSVRPRREALSRPVLPCLHGAQRYGLETAKESHGHRGQGPGRPSGEFPAATPLGVRGPGVRCLGRRGRIPGLGGERRRRRRHAPAGESQAGVRGSVARILGALYLVSKCR